MAIFKKNCWLERTPLEMGLLLILIVAVPFLIAMVSVYSVLLSQNCSNCSNGCGEHCERNPSNSSFMPMFLELHPNISLFKLAEKYEICPDSMLKHFEQKVDYAFVASVIEDVYADDLNYQRYLCAAAVITFKWVVSSSNCFENNNRTYTDVHGIYVRAGSNYWFRGGSVHEVEQVVFADKTYPATVAAIELKIEFPRLSSIRPIMLSRKSLYKNFGVAESYSWKSNDSVPLELRKKYVKLQSEPNIIFNNDQCAKKTLRQSYVFCARTVMPNNLTTCMLYSGFPIIRERILLGVNIGGFCDLKQNVLLYLIYDITNALKWLEETTSVYVELF